MRTKAEWQQSLEATLPPPTAYVARNRAITAHYATWYLQRPTVFKWAGMAALASAHVGIALAIAELLSAPQSLVTADPPPAEQNLLDFGLGLYHAAQRLIFTAPVALHNLATRPLLRNDLDLLKQGNDAIFNDIGWVHQAYLEAGLPAVEAGLAATDEAYLVSGFRLIDEGAGKLANPAEAEAGKALIFKGSIDLLRHEQQFTSQARLDQLTGQGKLVVSLGGMLDFDGKGIYGMGTAASFGLYFGLATLSRQRCLTNFADRWEWLEADAIPLWQEIDATYKEGSPFHQRLLAMANQEPTIWQQTTALVTSIYPAIELKFA